jgi:hypothetical protein
MKTAFIGNADEGDGVGDCTCSWAYDGYRQLKWHDGESAFGPKWNAGDTVGVMIDLDERVMRFSLNGNDLGPAFTRFEFVRGVFPAVSLNSGQSVQFNFGGPSRELKYQPDSYRPVHDAFVDEARGRAESVSIDGYVYGLYRFYIVIRTSNCNHPIFL